MQKSVKFAFFLQKTSLYMLAGQVPKCFGAGATGSPRKNGFKGGKHVYFHIFCS